MFKTLFGIYVFQSICHVAVLCAEIHLKFSAGAQYELDGGIFNPTRTDSIALNFT